MRGSSMLSLCWCQRVDHSCLDICSEGIATGFTWELSDFRRVILDFWIVLDGLVEASFPYYFLGKCEVNRKDEKVFLCVCGCECKSLGPFDCLSVCSMLFVLDTWNNSQSKGDCWFMLISHMAVYLFFVVFFIHFGSVLLITKHSCPWFISFTLRLNAVLT